MKYQPFLEATFQAYKGDLGSGVYLYTGQGKISARLEKHRRKSNKPKPPQARLARRKSTKSEPLAQSPITLHLHATEVIYPQEIKRRTKNSKP
jgi:hypothetical protein